MSSIIKHIGGANTMGGMLEIYVVWNKGGDHPGWWVRTRPAANPDANARWHPTIDNTEEGAVERAKDIKSNLTDQFVKDLRAKARKVEQEAALKDVEAAYLAKLIGKTVVQIVIHNDEGACGIGRYYGLRFRDGTEAAIMCDPEGNGPGHLEIMEA